MVRPVTPGQAGGGRKRRRVVGVGAMDADPSGVERDAMGEGVRPEGAATALYRSVDSGAKWEPIMEGLPSTLYGSVDAIAVDPQEANTVFADIRDPGATEPQPG